MRAWSKSLALLAHRSGGYKVVDLGDFRGTVKRDFPLRSLTTWRVGGHAELLAIPENVDDLLHLLEAAKSQSVPIYLLGGGSNVLIDDKGLRGITIRLGNAFRYLAVEGSNLRIGADTRMPMVAKKAAELGLRGFEHLIGIPGTIGAGIVMNAGKGTFDGPDMRSILQSVTYITEDLRVVTATAQDLSLDYRFSWLKGKKTIVVEAIFHSTDSAEPSVIQEEQRAILAERKRKFPLNLPNAGSVFMRPPNFPPAASLIDSAGLKGYRVGDAQVSQVHANFIVNLGNASSVDIIKLIEIVQEKVLQLHGVTLEREVMLLGNYASN